MIQIRDVLLGNIPVHGKKDKIVIYSVGAMPTEDVAWGNHRIQKCVEEENWDKTESLGNAQNDGIKLQD